MPARGPEPSMRTSFPTFISEAAIVFNWPASSTCASCAASDSNLLGAVTKSRPVSAEIASATRGPYSGCAFSPVPTAVPPSASSARRGRVESARAIPFASCAA